MFVFVAIRVGVFGREGKRLDKLASVSMKSFFPLLLIKRTLAQVFSFGLFHRKAQSVQAKLTKNFEFYETAFIECCFLFTFEDKNLLRFISS